MSLDFLSGLLLATVTLAIVVFVVKELLDDRDSASGKAKRVLGHSLDRLAGGEAKPINAHMIGAIGKVISHSDDDDRPMRVGLGSESWPARLSTPDMDTLPVGEAVRVIEVDGAVLVVAADDGSAGPSPTS